MGSGKGHRFGGSWTSRKLEVLQKYLEAYTTVLQGKPDAAHPFRKAYIDAFAGTGYRTMQAESDEASTSLVFPDLAQAEPQQLLDGSARLALKTHPRFDRYVFIERNLERFRQLQSLREEFLELASDIRIHRGEANEEIQRLCSRDWHSRRAVLFLDPYGLQVEWNTIKAVANTEAIDLWLLFPLGIGVNRLLTRSGEIPASWRARLDTLLGSKDWHDHFYRVERQSTLFGNHEERILKATQESIGQYFNQRLKSVFPGVAEPGILRNSANCPLYLLCFASGNRRGAPIALKIANHLLREVR